MPLPILQPSRRPLMGVKAVAKTRLRMVEASTSAGDAPEPWIDTLVETSHGTVSLRRTLGRGMPVLLLHGNSSSKDVFRGQMDRGLGDRYDMIALDFPGHGASADAIDPHRSYTIEGYAQVALEVLERLGLDHAAVFGWSLGGHVALELATIFPGITGIMATGTPPVGTSVAAIFAGFQPHPDLALNGQASLDEEEAGRLEALALGALADDDMRKALRRTDGRARARMFEHLLGGAVADQKRFVETSGIPLAIVNGANDPIVDLDYIDGLSYAKLWNRRCHVVPRAAHMPFLEQPAVFNHLFARFLKRLERRHQAQVKASGSLCFGG